MSDWMPSTEQVRSHYVFDQTDQWDRARGEAFDRWLAAHDAEIREAGRLAALEEAEKVVMLARPEMGHHINVTQYRQGR